MDKDCWIGRRGSAAIAMARGTTEAEARLVHCDLAGLYSLRAFHPGPFLLRRAASASEGEAAIIRANRR